MQADTKIPREFSDFPAIPKDLWGLILKNLGIYDTIFVRAASSALYKFCKEYRPFPKFFVLDQGACMDYLVENGFTSCADYAKNIMRFDWSNEHCRLAARSGQVDMLKFLQKNGLNHDNGTLLWECILGTCDLSTIRYLHESSASWPRDVLATVAHNGHVDCLKYAIQNGCAERTINYTPSIECLEYVIENGFDWHNDSIVNNQKYAFREQKSICEEASLQGNFTMLKYAHQKGAPLKDSVRFAALGGHLDCLKCAVEQSPKPLSVYYNSFAIKGIDCFKYMIEILGLEEMKDGGMWHNQALLGDLEILRFMHENHFPLPEYPEKRDRILVAASHSNNLAVTTFLFAEVGLAYSDADMHSIFAFSGNLDGLKIAFEQNYTFVPSPETRQFQRTDFIQDIKQNAVRSKNLDVVKLVWEKFPNKEGFLWEECQIVAAKQSTPEILDFLREKGAQWSSKYLTDASENLPNLAYLIRLGCKRHERSAISGLMPN